MIKFLLNKKQAKNFAVFGIFKVNFHQDPHQDRQSYILLFLKPPANSPFVFTPKTYQLAAHAKENTFQFQIEILQSAMSAYEFTSLAKNCPLLQLLDTTSNFHAHAYKVAIHFTDYS